MHHKMFYKSLVRRHLDCCIEAWRPYLKRDKEVLERVQKRATRMIDDCKGLNHVEMAAKGLSYEERLAMLGLTTLETRRLRADLIEVYKIVKGMDKVDEQSFSIEAIREITTTIAVRLDIIHINY